MTEKVIGPPSNVYKCRRYRDRKSGLIPKVAYTTDMREIENALRI